MNHRKIGLGLRREPTLSHRIAKTASALLLALAAAATAQAQTTVDDAWVRGTVAQQKVSGAYMQITSAAGGKLVGASSPLAGMVEIHEMAMDGNVMRMRALAGLDLPPGKPVKLKPGGYHIMLMDLKQPLKHGEAVPLTLTVEGLDGKRETIEVKAVVKATVTPALSQHKN
jgi:periplasmic copper chaperone A